MKKNIKILFKKEFRELVFSYKSLIAVLLCSMITYTEIFKDMEINHIIAPVFMMMVIGQYIYDSYLGDVSFKGALFLHNIKAKFWEIFFAKLCCASIIGVLMLLLTLPNLVDKMTLADIFLLVPLFVFAAALMQISTIYAKGSEMTAALFSTLIIFGVVFVLFQIEPIFLRCMAIVTLDIIILWLCEKMSHSLKYRTQL